MGLVYRRNGPKGSSEIDVLYPKTVSKNPNKRNRAFPMNALEKPCFCLKENLSIDFSIITLV